MQTVDINGMKIVIPDYYQKVDSMPGDPEGSVPYMVRSENAGCFIMIYPAEKEQAMPQDEDAIIHGMRQFLMDDQGLIEIGTGKDYAYTIIKTMKQPVGVQYTLTFHKLFPEKMLCIQGYFDEIGTTGIRDSIVLDHCVSEGIVRIEGERIEGWAEDPYDPDIKEGALMNLSEGRELDEMFPGFPLSLCRELADALTG